MNELLDPCALCGYREHNIPTSSDTGHDNCCCGRVLADPRTCEYDGPGKPCVNHEDQLYARIDGIEPPRATAAETMADWEEFAFYELDRLEEIPDALIGAPWFTGPAPNPLGR